MNNTTQRFKSAFLTILISLTNCCLNPLDSFTQDNNEKIIRRIEIERQDVFPVITGKPRFIYNWANSLHIVTKESVIRKELLFKSGDVFDVELLEESERKLRRLPYFGEAKITLMKEEPETVDISVVTQDQWSTLLSTIIQQGGGRTIFGGSIEEFNLLGFGKQIFTELRHETSEGTQLSLRYTDPQLFFSRWTTGETFVTGPFLKSFSAQLLQPFYSLDTKWAGGIAGSVRDETIRIFEQGNEINRYRLDSDGFQIFGGRALGSRFKKARLQLNYRFRKRDFTSSGPLTTDSIPEDELIHSLNMGLSFESLSFVKEKQIDKFLRTEDLTLGSITSMSVGRTGLPIPKGVKRFEFSIRRREAHQIFQKQYLIFIAGLQTLFEKDTIFFSRLQYYNKLLSNQTFALNFAFDFGLDLENPRRFILGGDSGLRGYIAREFSGAKRLLLNVEDRLFTSLNILTVALGGVLFLDAGNVWTEHESIHLSDLNYSIGFGLRLGYTKSPRSRVGRIDFAWPLKRGRGFGVSIGVDQQFSIN
ncbi:MAG: BamA/TamA family outer membrane protein [bacterium]